MVCNDQFGSIVGLGLVGDVTIHLVGIVFFGDYWRIDTSEDGSGRIPEVQRP